MSICWISDVPSKMVKILEVRAVSAGQRNHRGISTEPARPRPRWDEQRPRQHGYLPLQRATQYPLCELALMKSIRDSREMYFREPIMTHSMSPWAVIWYSVE
jgi:hypothetical protein